MKILFYNKKAQKLFGCQKDIMRNFGASVGKRIMQRLSELEAADSLQMVSHLPPPRCHELESSTEHVFSVDVSGNMRLLFSPCESFTVKPDDGIDLSSVKAVGIREVRDTHDGKVRR